MNEREVIYVAPPACKRGPSRFYAFSMTFWSIAVCGLYLLHSFFVKNPISLANKYSKMFAQKTLRAGHISVAAVNRQKYLDGKKSYIYMSNHPSMTDIPALALCIAQPMRMVGKSQLLYIPIFGWAMVRAGFVIIDREKRIKAIRQLEIAKKRVQDGLSIWMAPEGTRTRQEGMMPFKKGGFHLALELQVPIVPMWVDNTANIMPPTAFKVTPNQTATVLFGEPIPTAGLKKTDMIQLMEQVRTAMFSLRDSLTTGV